jgi:hypothetical protein
MDAGEDAGEWVAFEERWESFSGSYLRGEGGLGRSLRFAGRTKGSAPTRENNSEAGIFVGG